MFVQTTTPSPYTARGKTQPVTNKFDPPPGKILELDYVRRFFLSF